MHDLIGRPATELAAMVRSRSISAEALMLAHLQWIEQINPCINAFCTLIPEAALAAARALDRRIAAGAAPGLLAGLPVALKDLTPTRGIRTTRGSRLFAESVPEADAEIVRRIRAQDGIIVGKTNTPEFGHKGITDNLLFGATANPRDPTRVAGGSSGGSSAAVVTGMVPLAEGSDGAGSIRIPAALCGCFGFKPSFGVVPDVAGPFSSHTPFFHNGPLGRSVDDARLLLRAMAGFTREDPFSASLSIGDHEDLPMSRLRVAYSPDLGYFRVADDVARACRRAADSLAPLGCSVTHVTMPLLDADVERAFMIFWRARIAGFHSGLRPDELDLLEPVVQRLIEEGRGLGAVDIGWANQVRERVWYSLQALFEEYDLLLCPTTAVTAFPLDEDLPRAIQGHAINPLIGWFLTYPFNLTGHPAASIPCGVGANGMPVGMQVIGPRLADNRVLAACRAFERVLPWSQAALPDC